MKYIPADKLIDKIEKWSDGKLTLSLLTEIKEIITSLQQERPKKRLIQVRCSCPYDESWQKNKVYTCEVWHHGDLNRDFWDVYYDYGKDPRYVQFPSIELLNEEFEVIQEQPEVDLEKEIKAEWDVIDPDLLLFEEFKAVCYRFYELGLNARKEE